MGSPSQHVLTAQPVDPHPSTTTCSGHRSNAKQTIVQDEESDNSGQPRASRGRYLRAHVLAHLRLARFAEFGLKGCTRLAFWKQLLSTHGQEYNANLLQRLSEVEVDMLLYIHTGCLGQLWPQEQ